VNITAIAFRADRRPESNSAFGEDVDKDDFGPPKFIQVFTDHNDMDFSDAENGTLKPVQTLELSMDDESKTYEKFSLAGPKYSRISSMELFVSEAFEEREFSFLNHISLTGYKAVDYHNNYK